MYFQETPRYGQYTYDVLVGKFITLSNQFKDYFVLSEWHLYGSSRLGIQKPNALNSYAQLTSATAGKGRELVHIEFSGSWSEYEVNYADTHYTTVTTYQMSYEYYSLSRGEKNYEMTNHLGNVLVVISDKKLKTCTGDTVNYYTADVVQANDYYAFHATMSGRTYTADTTNKYRFGGSNGQEKDDEIFAGAYSAEYWEYDSRLGRRWNVDPVVKHWESPYAAFGNNPAFFTDVKGLDNVPPKKFVPAAPIDKDIKDMPNVLNVVVFKGSKNSSSLGNFSGLFNLINKVASSAWKGIKKAVNNVADWFATLHPKKEEPLKHGFGIQRIGDEINNVKGREPAPGLKVYTAYQDMLDAIELGTKDLMIPYNSPSRGTLNDELNTGTSSRLEPKGKDKFGEWSNVNDPNPITQTTSVGVQRKIDTITIPHVYIEEFKGHGNVKIRRENGNTIDTISYGTE